MSTTPRPRILIVDDNPAIHGDFRKVLGTASADHATPSDSEAALFGEPVATQPTESGAPEDSYEIDDALQGEEALAKVVAARKEGRPYSMTFLDVRMPPGWDGVQTARALWEADPDLQVVLCTAFSDYTWPQTIAELGRTDRLLILKKPFDSVEVCQLAASLTEKRASLQRERENLAAARKAELEAGEDLALRHAFDAARLPVVVVLGAVHAAEAIALAQHVEEAMVEYETFDRAQAVPRGAPQRLVRLGAQHRRELHARRPNPRAVLGAVAELHLSSCVFQLALELGHARCELATGRALDHVRLERARPAFEACAQSRLVRARESCANLAETCGVLQE